MSRHFVLNDNTLIYIIKEKPFKTYGILGANIHSRHGGIYGLDGWSYLNPSDKLREATEKDFEIFRVSPKGHIK